MLLFTCKSLYTISKKKKELAVKNNLPVFFFLLFISWTATHKKVCAGTHVCVCKSLAKCSCMLNLTRVLLCEG